MFRRMRVIIIAVLLIMPLQHANAGLAGFRVRKSNGDSLPGACSFIAKKLSSKASSIVSSALSKSKSDKAISYFPSYARSDLRDYLRSNTPEYAVHVRCHTYFSVTGYQKSIGAVVIRIDSGTSTSTSYRYVAMIGTIYEDGSVGWRAAKASASSGTFKVTLSSSLCESLSKSGRSCVIIVLGETYRWW